LGEKIVGKGFLKIQTVTLNGAVAVDHAKITITDENNILMYELVTDEFGHAPKVELETIDKQYTDNPDYPGCRYKMYNVQAKKHGYTPVWLDGVMILDTSTSLLKVDMDPVALINESYAEHKYIGGHKLDYPVDQNQQVNQEEQQKMQEIQELDISSHILPEVIIPNFIRVHLGREENTSARTVNVSYTDYIKNVASHEIMDTWPEQSIIANVYCIISLTLNRIYTEFYRKKGRNYDITSETNMDHKYVHDGVIGERISAVVDKIYNNCLAIVGHKEPFLSLYNDGMKVNMPGRLSQWGSMYDARDRGMNAWQIITKYYSQPLELREIERFGVILESFPGYTLTVGMQGNAVRTMQLFLNRIIGRYSDVIIRPIDGIFGQQLRNSVVMFQRIYNLPQTGNIDRRTWYEISRIYAVERALWEMHSEGQRIGIGTAPHTRIVRRNDTGALVVELQFLLDLTAMYHRDIPFVPQTSRFDSLTEEAVRAFQRLFAINSDGIVGATTWRELYDVYWGIVGSGTPPQPPPEFPIETPDKTPPFPGTSLRVGSTGTNVRLVQEALNRVAEITPGLWRIAEDGVFGNDTQDVVMAFQRIFGLTVDGIVGSYTWRKLMEKAYFTDSGSGGDNGGGATIPPFPGTSISIGSSGQNVRFIQEAINKLAPCYQGSLWPLNTDGIFGNVTKDAVMTFQIIFGLVVDGIVGPASWRKLMEEAANANCGSGGGGTTPSLPQFPGNLSIGSSGQNVRLVQEAINKLAPSYPGRLWILNVDERFGNMTRDAIYTFQSIFGLPITGVINQSTWDRLMREST